MIDYEAYSNEVPKGQQPVLIERATNEEGGGEGRLQLRGRSVSENAGEISQKKGSLPKEIVEAISNADAIIADYSRLTGKLLSYFHLL